MELSAYPQILRRYWRSTLSAVLIGLAAGAALSLLVPPTYTAKISLFISVQSAATAGELQQGSTYAENQVTSFAAVATKPFVLQPVIDRLGLQVTPEKLAGRVTATAPNGTAIIEISVTGRVPVETADLANAVGAELISAVAALAPPGAEGTDAVTATIVAPAAVPTSRTAPKASQNVVLGLGLGLLVGVGQAILRDRLDVRIVRAEDIAKVTGRSVVGTVHLEPEARDRPLVFWANPHSLRAEEYRRLRTNLQFLTLEGTPRAFVVTSSVPGEGKTTTSINIAAALADAGESVLLVDADLRDPNVADFLNLDRTPGLTTVMMGQASLSEVAQPVGTGNLHVLAAGQLPPNPSELLGSDALARVLAEAVSQYDNVIVDSPPLVPVTDAAILSRVTGGTLMVVGSGIVTEPDLAQALTALEVVDSNVLGLVLNRAPGKRGRHYSYQYWDYRSDPPQETLQVDQSVRRTGHRSTPVSPAEIFLG